MEIDGELAKKLFAEGAALVLLDVPERTEFGIDYNSWTVGPKFKGVKMIPPGFHFIYYRLFLPRLLNIFLHCDSILFLVQQINKQAN